MGWIRIGGTLIRTSSVVSLHVEAPNGVMPWVEVQCVFGDVSTTFRTVPIPTREQAEETAMRIAMGAYWEGD